MMDLLFQQSAVFNVASSIQCHLSSSSPLFQRPPLFRIGVGGQLAVTDFATRNSALAACTFIASDAWLRRPIQVFCHESWLKHDIDWHVFGDGSLCYEFDGRWALQLAQVAAKNDLPDLADYAAMWCVNGTRKLLEKHLLADRLNITNWRPEWKAWPHGRAAAAREYSRELRRAG